jgi:hypothetical protein
LPNINSLSPNKTALERACEIARLGRCKTIQDIRIQLRREGLELASDHTGPVLTQQLLGIARRARAAAREDA